jgi:hypothetical protein
MTQSAAATPSRLIGDWHTSALISLPNSKPPLPPGSADTGLAPASTRLDRMLLLLDPSTAQKKALDTELANQLDPSSSEFHRWLTPSAFADAYANSASDVAAIASWLQSQGFQLSALPAGRGWIEFSGTAAQVEQAFQTQVHSFATPAGSRFALSDSISVPSVLRPLIHGLTSLDGVAATPALTTPLPVATAAPALAAATSRAQAEALTPQLAAQLLHLDTLHAAGTNGAGETIAIAARSNMHEQDVSSFRNVFGLPALSIQITPNGPDPGENQDETGVLLSAAWAGAAAPGAHVLVVPAATTTATDGLDLSLAAIVDQSIAHIVSIGYSACETSLSESRQAFYAALYRQAAVQGMTVIAAAGDSGPSACHAAGSDAAVDTGYAVSAPASTPWNTVIGAAAMSSTQSDTGEPILQGWSPLNPTDPAYAGGGGSSTYYPAPAWQPLPSQNSSTSSAHFRLLPDVSLPTAFDNNVNRGVAFCFGSSAVGSTAVSGCSLVRSGGSAAASAIFAGIAALVVQKNGPQGNIAPELYTLSRRSGIFNDVQQGDARLTCILGSAGCNAAGQIGFSAVAGYDMATGLGSVNAQNLVSEWAIPQAAGTSSVTVNPPSVSPIVPNTTYNPSSQLTFSTTVVSGTGGATPTGTVNFYDNTTSASLSTSPSAISANGVATVTITGGLQTGGNNTVAQYSGDSTYAAATSQPLVVTIELSPTSLTVVPSTAKPTAGVAFPVTVNITTGSPSGVLVSPPTGKITLNVDGLPTATASLTTSGGVTAAIFPSVLITSAGDHPLQATYAGDANYVASTAPAVTVTISKGATVTALSAVPATLTAGTPETLTATIAPANAASGTTYSVTGTVSFYDGTVLLGTGVVNANSASLANVSLTAGVLHTITAVYSGDTSWAASTSNAIALQSVLLPDTVTLSVNINTTAPGQVVTLTATVTPSSVPASNTEQNPTGNIIFYDGTSVIGTVALTTSLNYSATATLITGALPGGQNVLTALYVGDLYYAPGTSNPVTIDVEDFSITPSPSNPPTNLTIVKGSSGSASFIVKGLGGFNNQIQVVCAVPTQDDMTCAVTPQQVTPTATVTFTVQTYAAGGTTVARNNRVPIWPRAAGGAALAVLIFLFLPMGGRARLFTERTRRPLVLLLLLAGLGGAGIGCNSSVVTTGSNSGTPLGVATLTITAASYVDNTVVSHSVFLTVNVIPPASAASAPPTARRKW